MSHDPLNISRVGNRGNHPSSNFPTSGQERPQSVEFEEKTLGITNFILEAMDENSLFFQKNPSFPLPQFESDQVTLDQVLGTGEFGKVSAVQALHVEENCSCPKCCKPSPDCCTQEINGGTVPLCCGSPVKVKSASETAVHPNEEPGESDACRNKSSCGTASTGTSTSISADKNEETNGTQQSNGICAKKSSDGTSSAIRNSTSEADDKPQVKVVLDSGFSVTDDNPKLHRRKSTAVSFADLVALVLPLDEQDDDSTLSSEEDDDENDLTNNGEIMFWRGYMSAHVIRQGRSRYAMKRLREDLPQRKLLSAITDLAAEAKFMSSMRHPNICKMRGTVSQPGKRDFAIVMDNLVQTLRQKMDDWKDLDEKGSRFSVLERLLKQPKNKKDEQLTIQKERYADKLLAMYDAARALRYLHNHSIVFRDLKPENFAFDMRGDLRLFDFGLAKELKPQDLVEFPDLYNLTGLTGSRRYMAPEVILCKDYGLSVDVYSFAIVFWEVMSNQLAYAKMNFEKHFEHAVQKKKRPNMKKMIPHKQLLPNESIIHDMVEKAWTPNPRERPNILKICDCLSTEVLKASHGGSIKATDRTNWLANRSLKSRCGSAL